MAQSTSLLRRPRSLLRLSTLVKALLTSKVGDFAARNLHVNHSVLALRVVLFPWARDMKGYHLKVSIMIYQFLVSAVNPSDLAIPDTLPPVELIRVSRLSSHDLDIFVLGTGPESPS